MAGDRTEYFRAWHAANRDRQAELAASRKAADPDRWRAEARSKNARYRARMTPQAREAAREASRAWHAAHPDYATEWRSANGERSRGYGRKWAVANRAQLAAKASRRRGVPLTDEAKAWLPVLLADPCAYCGNGDATLDHIIPIACGGTGELGNLAPACGTCNSSKADRPLLTFLLARG